MWLLHFTVTNKGIPVPRLTKKVVEALQPSEVPRYFWDDQLPGFGVKITPTGKRRYVCKYRVGGGRTGRQRWYFLGLHGQITCDQARDQAIQIFSVVSRGEDPQATKEANRNAPTLTDLWTRYQVEHLPKKKLHSVQDDRQKARDFILPALGHHKVANITRSDIQVIHQKLADRPYQANRVLALLSKMFSLAEVWGYRPDNSNPCHQVERYKEKARQRYLSQAELKRLAQTLDRLGDSGPLWPYIIAAIKLLLFTGARVSEILNAQWAWVDWENRVIQLPDSKTGAKPIFLSEPALAILLQLKSVANCEENAYIIHGHVKGKSLVNISKPWKRICEEAGISGVRIHDLRHTAASFGVAHGLNLPVIGRLLGHTQHQTTQRYAHVDTDPALLAANTIAKALSQAMAQDSDNANTSIDSK